MKFQKKPRKKIETSKKLIAFLFLNCTLIELFVGYVTIASLQIAATVGLAADFSPLLTVVGAVVTEVIGYAIYAIKATKENTKDGIRYLTAQHELNEQEEQINE